MRLIDALELVLERLVERPTARLFPSLLQPVRLQRRLERAMELERVVDGDRTDVPDSYRVRLHPDDLAGLAPAAPDLEAGLATALAAHSRGRGYYLRRAPAVRLLADARVRRGEPLVVASFADQLRSVPSGALVAAEAGAAEAGAAEAGAAEATAVYAVPPASLPTAVLVVAEPGHTVRRIPVASGRLRIGRAPDNELVLADARVSRHHGELRARRGALVYTDLGSTNGTWLGGSPVRELAVGPGDRLELGGTTITVEPA